MEGIDKLNQCHKRISICIKLMWLQQYVMCRC